MFSNLGYDVGNRAAFIPRWNGDESAAQLHDDPTLVPVGGHEAFARQCPSWSQRAPSPKTRPALAITNALRHPLGMTLSQRRNV